MSPRAGGLLGAEETILEALALVADGHAEDGYDVGTELLGRRLADLLVDALQRLVLIAQKLERLGHARHRARRLFDLGAKDLQRRFVQLLVILLHNTPHHTTQMLCKIMNNKRGKVSFFLYQKINLESVDAQK